MQLQKIAHTFYRAYVCERKTTLTCVAEPARDFAAAPPSHPSRVTPRDVLLYHHWLAQSTFGAFRSAQLTSKKEFMNLNHTN